MTLLNTQAMFLGAGRFLSGLVVVSCLSLTACEEAIPPQAEVIRSIKPYYVVEPTGGDVRRYSGSIAAAKTSTLSFAVAGTVENVSVSQGDHVLQGDELAVLDRAPFTLDVQAAQSQLAAAQADFDNKKLDLARQRQLYERGWVAKAALDQATAIAEAAEGELNLARSRLGHAERDLANTTLIAPFDGVVARRDVDAFAEVAKGQTVFQLDSEGAFEVTLSVPDAIVGRLAVGSAVTVNVFTLPECGCTGRIVEIGAVAGAANAVTVKAAILENGRGLFPGMAAEVSVVLAGGNGTEGYLVPLVSIAPGDDNLTGYVFRFDPETGTVSKIGVQTEGVISGNLVGITHGVSAGDIVAAAGVSFLRDGQRVKLIGQ